MNKLSWFLYLADAFSSLVVLFAIFGTILSAVTVVAYFARFICRCQRADMLMRRALNDVDILYWDTWIAIWTHLCQLKIGFALVFIACLIPSKSTMYAITASQVGEQVIKSEAVQGLTNDATRALNVWIKKQLETKN